MDKKVSVIIPVYNSRKTIEKCIKQLVNQSYPAEIIIIDDGSTDNTVEIAKKFNIKLLNQKHKGPGAARNLGVSKAKGDIIVFVDSDEYCDKDYIKNLVRPILDGKAIGTVSSNVRVANAGNKWARCWSISHGLDKDKLSIRIAESDIFRAILKKRFLGVGGFDENIGYSDDRLSKKLGIRAFVVDNAKFYHEYPSNLSDIYKHAVWIGKSEDSRKRPFIGVIAHFFVFSFFRGFFRGIRYSELSYVLFKIVFDFGLSVGIVKAFFTRNYAK